MFELMKEVFFYAMDGKKRWLIPIIVGFILLASLLWIAQSFDTSSQKPVHHGGLSVPSAHAGE